MPDSALPERADIVVVGGGLAGLTAALHLAERGVSPLVLEADPTHCGGRVSGGDEVEIDGWHFPTEHGVHAIWSPYRNLQAMLTRHAIRPTLVPAQEERWFYRRGGQVRWADIGSAIRQSWIPAPFHYLNLFLRSGFLGMLSLHDWLSLPLVWYGLILSVGIDPLGEDQPLEGLWLDDLVRGWSPALRTLFIGLARNGLSARPGEVPLSGFIAFLRFYTLLRRDAWTFGYLPADGGASLIEPLLRQVLIHGGTVQNGVRAARMEPLTDGYQIAWKNEAGNQGVLCTGQVILAVDAGNARELLLSSPVFVGAASHLYWPRSMGTAVVRFWFDRSPEPRPEAGILSGAFILDNFFWLHRIQEPYVRWHRATGCSAIEGHIYGPPELLAEPDAVLLAQSSGEMLSVFPELHGHVIHRAIQRNDPVHTLFGLGPAGRHLGIETPWPGLFCCGDWVRHPSPSFFMERACVTGIAAANAVLCSRQLIPWPLIDSLPPEPFVGWIERLMHRGRRGLRRLARRS